MLVASAAVDPVQAGSEFARHAEGWPITIGFFLMFGLFAVFFLLLLVKGWPQWLTEQATNRAHREAENEKTRSHIDSMLTGSRKEAADLVAAERAAAKERHAEIVGRVSDKVDKLHENVDKLHQRTGAIAAKLGITGFVALIVGAALLGLLRVAAPLPALVAETCNPPCPAGQKCSGSSPARCVEDKKDQPAVGKPQPRPPRNESKPGAVAAMPDGGHSAKRYLSYATLATALCDQRTAVCL